MKFKGDVTYSIAGIVKILLAAELVYNELGRNCVVTSLMDGTHMEGSKHYVGNAADLRIYYFNNAQKRIAVRRLKEELGMGYDVVLEGNHIHVEYDPKEEG